MDCRDGANCNNLQVSVVNTGVVDIKCSGSSTQFGCQLGQVNAANADQLYIYAGYNGIYDTTIYGQNIATTFEITAFGTNTSFVGITGATEIYTPINLSKFSLNCYGFGCYEMDFINENGFDDAANANFNVNGCFKCYDRGMF